jgi:hypothetical protein
LGEQGAVSKGARVCGGGRRTSGRGRVHGGNVGERSGTADGWGPRGKERESACEKKWRRQVGPIEQQEGERERRGAGVSADRQGPPVRDRGRAWSWA